MCIDVFSSLEQNSGDFLWTGPSRDVLMSSTACSSMCTGSLMLTCSWVMPMSMATCCRSTTMTTTTKLSPWQCPCSASSCSGKVSVVFEVGHRSLTAGQTSTPYASRTAILCLISVYICSNMVTSVSICMVRICMELKLLMMCKNLF